MTKQVLARWPNYNNNNRPFHMTTTLSLAYYYFSESFLQQELGQQLTAPPVISVI